VFGNVELLPLDELRPQFEALLAELQFVSGSWPVKDRMVQAFAAAIARPKTPATFRTVTSAVFQARIFLDGTGENGARARELCAELCDAMQEYEGAARLLLVD